MEEFPFYNLDSEEGIQETEKVMRERLSAVSGAEVDEEGRGGD